MEQVEHLLLDLVKEKGIVDIIMNYKEELERVNTTNIYSSLDVIDSLMLDWHLNNFNQRLTDIGVIKKQ